MQNWIRRFAIMALFAPAAALAQDGPPQELLAKHLPLK
jgi:hypothetical protein